MGIVWAGIKVDDRSGRRDPLRIHGFSILSEGGREGERERERAFMCYERLKMITVRQGTMEDK